MIDGHGDDIYKYGDIRFNFSSNVYGHFSHDGLFAWLAGRLDGIRNYPEPEPRTAECAVAGALELLPSQVMVTNGATEAIYLVSQTFRCSMSAILVPTFSEYADACRIHGHRIEYIRNIVEIPHGTQIVWICNPNNPTGRVCDKDTVIRSITDNPDILFVIDASYAPFTHCPLILAAEVVALPNVIMLSSMTKEFAIPGLRLGYVTANAALLDKIRGQRMPWSVNTVAQEACRYLLAHKDAYAIPLDVLLGERERVGKALAATGCVEPEPSDTHMLLCRLTVNRAQALKNALAGRYGILIRDASNFEGLDGHYFRIAVQTPVENDMLIKAFYDLRCSITSL